MTVWDFPFGIWGLSAALIVSCGLVVLSYCTIFKTLPLFWKCCWSILRILFLLLLFFCLCNPRTETSRRIRSERAYRIAVLIDDSGSMRKQGIWKRSRLEDALKFLRENLPRSSKHYQFRFYGFSDTFRPVPSPELLTQGKKGNAETDFLGMLTEKIPQLEAEGMDGVILLTDGIDTLAKSTPETAEGTLAAAGMRILFVPMTTTLEASPHLSLRKVEAPVSAVAGTEIQQNFMIRKVNLPRKANAVLKLLRNGELLAEWPLRRENGMETISFRLPVKHPGKDHFSAELFLDGVRLSRCRWSMDKFIRKNTGKILLYNGALDYGIRFIRNVLRTDRSWQAEVVFAPGVVHAEQSGKKIRFDHASDLEQYDGIVLFNLNRRQITPEMERGLRQYVEHGGGLLFLTGNPAIAAEYSNSPLEKLLPVTFEEHKTAEKRYDVRTAGIVRLITSGRRRPTDFDRALQKNSEMRYKNHPLRTFTLTAAGRENPVFRHKTETGSYEVIAPQFEDFARVKAPKSGANVLAVWPDENGNRTREHILMAVQNFGQGRSIVLATDPLWRWKLKLPSSSNASEMFWKNLFSYLASGRDSEPQWIFPNRIVRPGEENSVLFQAGKSQTGTSMNQNDLKFSVKAPDGVWHPSAGVPEGDKRIRLSFSPEKPGDYLFRAEWGGGRTAEARLTVEKHASQKQEDLSPEPDLNLLKRMASLPNVQYLDEKEGLDLAQSFPPETTILKEREIIPVWLKNSIYLLLVLLLCAEWILRRKFGKLI